MAGIGSFAGGFASGLGNAFDMAERKKRMDREEKEYQRKEGLRREAANTIGNIGQTREDGSTYTEDQAYRDYARLGAQYDPDAAMAARGRGLQIAGAKRTEDRAATMQKIQDIAMQVQAGAITEEEGLRQLAGVHGPHPDGKQAFIVNVGGQPHAVLGDENSRTGVAHPVTGDGSTFMKAYQGLLSVMDPGYGQKQQELGIRSRQATAAETTAGAAQTRAQTEAGLAVKRENVLDAQAGYYRNGGRAYASMANSRNFQPAGMLQDGTPVAFDAHRGVYVRADSGKPLDGGQLKLFQRVTGERGVTPIGSDGTFYMNGRVYTPNPDPKAPQRFIDATPGESIIDRLRRTNGGSPGDGRPSLSVPGPSFHPVSVGLNPFQRFLGLNARPDVAQGGRVYRDPLTGEGIDADTWQRKYGEAPPQ